MQEGSEFFFELANADVVRYRTSSGEVVIKQDREISGLGQEAGVPQTGGIVWETAFLLAMFLKHRYSDSKGPAALLEVHCP